MKYRIWLSIVVIVLVGLACNLLQSGTAGQAENTPTLTSPTQIPDTPLPSSTPLPTATSLPTLTPTPTTPITWAIDKGVNCRYGPGLEWEVVSALLVGTNAEILGKNAPGDWWFIRDPLNQGGFCWVAAGVTNAAGNLGALPIVDAPSASVTRVTVDAVASYVACGGPNPITFSGTITTNGPATVTYQWEIGGDKTNTSAPETIGFNSADTKNVPDPGAYTADCGNYFVRLHVTDPSDKAAKKDFKIGP
jgi:hypothetical protein